MFILLDFKIEKVLENRPGSHILLKEVGFSNLLEIYFSSIFYEYDITDVIMNNLDHLDQLDDDLADDVWWSIDLFTRSMGGLLNYYLGDTYGQIVLKHIRGTSVLIEYTFTKKPTGRAGVIHIEDCK